MCTYTYILYIRTCYCIYVRYILNIAYIAYTVFCMGNGDHSSFEFTKSSGKVFFIYQNKLVMIFFWVFFLCFLNLRNIECPKIKKKNNFPNTYMAFLHL